MGNIDFRAMGLAVVLGTIGGAVFKWLTVPLPWMLGAMCFTTIAAMSGVKVVMPRNVRNGFVTILGVLLGSGFTPAVLGRLGEWGMTLAALTVWVFAAGGLSYFYLRRVAGHDKTTAFFGATPGGLAEMTLVGSQFGADPRVLSLIHTVRVMATVLIVPIWFRLEGLVGPLPAKATIGVLEVALNDYAILAACALVGAYIGVKFRLPAGTMLGPMAVSMAVHLGGFSEAQPPYEITAAAQIVLGCAIGQRFAGTRLSAVARIASHGLVVTLIMLGLAIAFAATMSRATDESFAALVLAYSPGGFAEMSLVALALSVDSALVAAHHLYRIVFIVSLAPLLFRRIVTKT
jgi:uncharacterized protein